MATVPALTDRTPAQRWAEVKDEEALWGDLRPELLAAVRSPTVAQPTGSCMAACSASTSSWQRACSSHSHKSLDVIGRNGGARCEGAHRSGNGCQNCQNRLGSATYGASGPRHS
jgi:hypothetical protein